VVQQRVATSTIAVLALMLSVGRAHAEMGPCLLNGHQSLYCGEGNGAARIIRDTSSPSRRLALAWRLINRPPLVPPNDGDPDLENLIVRISDGAILAKSRGFYWDLGDRYAPGQYVRAAWSPDSRLLIRTAGRIGVPDRAELFTFTDDNSVIGPFDLVSVFDPVVRPQMKDVKDADQYLLRFSYRPAIAIDDQGLIHASVYMQPRDSGDGPIYELTARVERTANSLDAKVLSISEYFGPSVSVIVHLPSDRK
jgi:hypothetical protein